MESNNGGRKGFLRRGCSHGGLKVTERKRNSQEREKFVKGPRAQRMRKSNVFLRWGELAQVRACTFPRPLNLFQESLSLAVDH